MLFSVLYQSRASSLALMWPLSIATMGNMPNQVSNNTIFLAITD